MYRVVDLALATLIGGFLDIPFGRVDDGGRPAHPIAQIGVDLRARSDRPKSTAIGRGQDGAGRERFIGEGVGASWLDLSTRRPHPRTMPTFPRVTRRLRSGLARVLMFRARLRQSMVVFVRRTATGEEERAQP
jgi:hypothetical protein